jgi:hypothetical protein
MRTDTRIHQLWDMMIEGGGGAYVADTEVGLVCAPIRRVGRS